MRIQITFRTRSGTGPVTHEISPEDYFDPLEPGENYEEHGVAKFNHTEQYLEIPVHELLWTVEERCGTTEDRTIRTQYTNNGSTWMAHRRDPDGYEEIIHNTCFSDGSRHIIRTHKDSEGNWVAGYNGVWKNEGTPSEEEERFDDALDRT